MVMICNYENDFNFYYGNNTSNNKIYNHAIKNEICIINNKKMMVMIYEDTY